MNHQKIIEFDAVEIDIVPDGGAEDPGR